MDSLDVSARLGTSRLNNSTVNSNPITKRFNRPLLPAAYLGETEAAVNAEARTEMSIRKQRVQSLYQQRIERREDFVAKDKAYRDFMTLADEFMVADNARVPTDAQNQTINNLNSSISDVVLSGDQNAGNERARISAKISSKLLKLQEASEQSRKLWDTTVKDHEEESKSLSRLEETSGIDGGAIQGNAILYCPYRSEKTMIRSSDEIIIDIWNRINGPQMLELRFDRTKSLLEDLKKSLRAEVRTHPPCKY